MGEAIAETLSLIALVAMIEAALIWIYYSVRDSDDDAP
jgi:hypothetical protein